MEWKMNIKNGYPDVMLSDCIIDGIQMDNLNVVIRFSKTGIIVKESNNLQYYRTHAAQVILKNCDINNISMKMIQKKGGIINRKTEILRDICVKKFYNNIANAKWRFEVVEEFYSDVGGIYIGKVRNGKESFWCYIKVYFNDILYLWNEIDYKCSVI